MLSVGLCGVARLQMKVGHMDGMHCFTDSTILVKIKSFSLYNCRTVYSNGTVGAGFCNKFKCGTQQKCKRCTDELQDL